MGFSGTSFIISPAAIVLACLAVMLAPILLAMNTVYSMNSLDIFVWVMAAYLIMLIIASPKPRWWILLGLLLGLGLLNKVGVLWLGLGFFIGLVLTKHRVSLKTRWPWAAGILALVLFMPFIIWNFKHDLAHLEFMRNATMFKYAGITLHDFLLGLVITMNPVTVPLWLAGLLYFLFGRQGRT